MKVVEVRLHNRYRARNLQLHGRRVGIYLFILCYVYIYRAGSSNLTDLRPLEERERTVMQDDPVNFDGAGDDYDEDYSEFSVRTQGIRGGHNSSGNNDGDISVRKGGHNNIAPTANGGGGQSISPHSPHVGIYLFILCYVYLSSR
jgi:hypothetical protein